LTGTTGGQKNKGRLQRIKAFIHEKEESRRRVELKMDYDRLVDKSYQKKRRRGLSNSYIDQIPTSTPGTTTNKNKEKQIDASTTNLTDLFVGLSAEEQADIENMFQEQLAHVIEFYEQIGMPIGGILSLQDLPTDKNFVPRWCFELGQPLVKPELVNKLPTNMRRFHDWYLKKLADGLEMFGILMRPGDFALQNKKVVWIQFKDIYEVYHLDAVNTDLMMA
jgi:hypothetical protein